LIDHRIVAERRLPRLTDWCALSAKANVAPRRLPGGSVPGLESPGYLQASLRDGRTLPLNCIVTAQDDKEEWTALALGTVPLSLTRLREVPAALSCGPRRIASETGDAPRAQDRDR